MIHCITYDQHLGNLYNNKLPLCQQWLENPHPLFWALDCEYGAWSVPVRSSQKGVLNFYILKSEIVRIYRIALNEEFNELS